MKKSRKLLALITAASLTFVPQEVIPDNVFGALSVTANADNIDESTWDILNGELRAYHGSAENIVIPENVRVINEEVFMDHTEIVSVTFPAKLERIYDKAFCGCSNLSELIFAKPKTMLMFYHQTFKDCTSLREVNFPEALADPFGTPFEGCTGVEKVTFAEGSTKVPDDLLDGMTGIKTVVLADSIERIGDKAFANPEISLQTA